MAYTKKTWVKGSTPLSAENFNHMEQGIADAHTEITQLNSDMQSLIYAKYAYPILDIANGSQIVQTYSYKDLGINESCGIFFASLQQTYSDSKIFQGLDYSIKWDSSKVVFKIINTSGSTFYSIPFTLTVLAANI